MPFSEGVPNFKTSLTRCPKFNFFAWSRDGLDDDDDNDTDADDDDDDDDDWIVKPKRATGTN